RIWTCTIRSINANAYRCAITDIDLNNFIDHQRRPPATLQKLSRPHSRVSSGVNLSDMNLARPKISPLDGGIFLQRCASAGADDAPRLDQTAAVGHLEALPSILLDQQDADTGRAD